MVRPGLAAHLTSLFACGVLVGFVVAAAIFPAVAATGLAAKAGSDAFEALPAELDLVPAPQISYVYASDGTTLLARLYNENRHDVPLSQVAPVMRQAIVASEDSRFYHHHGVDPRGVARAYVANQRGEGVAQGASTLTMQYVRQARSYSARAPQDVIDATTQTTARKVQEMRYALALEKKYSKAEILERYLNIASFGHGAYGIYAASQVYFGKTPGELTLPEAALLAGLVKAPSAYDPADPAHPEKRRAALARRNDYVLRQMVALHDVTGAQAEAAKAVEPTILGTRTPEGCTSVSSELSAGYFCDFLYRWWLAQPAFGVDEYERGNNLRNGGYTIISSLDVTTQAAAKRNAQAALPATSPYALMMAAVEPGTGRVLSLAMNRTYSNDQNGNGPNTNSAKAGQKGNYPNTTLPLITGGGDVVGYQTGSTYKIFTMAAALEHGFPLSYTINTTSPYRSQYVVTGPASCGGRYCPQNANPGWMNGPRTMWTGFGRSVNTYFVPLEERVGAENAVAMAKRLGVQFLAHGTPGAPSDYELSQDPERAHGWGPFTLGVVSTTPLELVNAYATMAADGAYCEPIPVIEIRDPHGARLDAAKPRCRPAVSPDVARGVVDAARCPLGDQSAFGRCDGATAAEVRGVVGRPVAGKTGTTDGDKTATLVAMTRQVAIVGIMADPDNPFGARSMSAPAVNRAVATTLRDAMANKPGLNFTPPSQVIAFGKGGSPTPTPHR